jgi:hypothetical protein
VRIEVVLKEVSGGKNGAKMLVARENSLPHPKVKLQNKHL